MNFWEVMAQAFVKNQYVLGYDIFNEPWPANFYENSQLLTDTKYFDKTVLFPMWQRAHEHVRKFDDNKIIFWEPAQFPDILPFFGGEVMNVGFEATPGGDDYINRESLNDHSYCCQAAGSMCDTGEPPLDQADTCRAFHKQRLDVRSQDAERLKVPLILSEFGACTGSEACAKEVNSVVDACEDHLTSWMYWQYKGFGDFTTTGSLTEGMYDGEGKLFDRKLNAILRSYSPAYQGTPTMMKNTEDGSFTTSFKYNKSVEAQTILFFNPKHFEGVDFGSMTVTADKQDITYKLYHIDGQNAALQIIDAIDGQEIFVTVSPKRKVDTDIMTYGDYMLQYYLEDAETGFVSVEVDEFRKSQDDTFTLLIEDAWGKEACKISMQGKIDEKKKYACEVPSHKMIGSKATLTENNTFWFDKLQWEGRIPFMNGVSVRLTFSG